MQETVPTTIHYDQARFNAPVYFRRYTGNKWLYVASILLCLGIAVLYWWISIPQYRIQSTIVIKDEKKGEANSTTLKELDFLDEQKIVDNEAEIVKSESVISKVVEQLALNMTCFGKVNFIKYVPLYNEAPVTVRFRHTAPPAYNNPIDIILIDSNQYKLAASGNTYRFGEWVAANQGTFSIDKTEYLNTTTFRQLRITVARPEEVTQNIKKGISVGTPTKNSSILNISMLHPSPEKGTAILQMIIDEYNNANIREKRAQTDTILHMVEERLTLIANQLNTYGNKEQNFKVQQGITNLSDDSRMFLDKVKENDNLISQNRILLDMLSAVEKHISTGKTAPNTGINDPILSDMINRLGQLELEKERLLRTTGENNALVITKINQIRDIKQSINQNIQLQRQNIQNTLTRLLRNKSDIDSRISTVPGSERNLLEIIREKNIRENVYIFLLQKREEASLNSASAFSNMRVIDRPYSTARPVKPGKLVVFGMALFLGILLPTIFINLRAAMNTRINSRKTIESKLPGYIAGDIPHVKKGKKLVISDQSSIVAEQFRQIRTYINKLTGTQPSKTILITSSIPGEGKTLISINLAASFSLLKKKTVIIDLDLRKPRLHQLFGLSDGKDLSLYLHDPHQDINMLVWQHPEMPFLHVLAPAAAVEQPSEILTAHHFENLFSTLKQSYEYIIINTPPHNIFTDAQLLEKFSDASLFIVRYNYTPLAHLDTLQQIAAGKDFKNMRVVINDVPLKALHERNIYKSKYFKNKQVT